MKKLIIHQNDSVSRHYYTVMNRIEELYYEAKLMSGLNGLLCFAASLYSGGFIKLMDERFTGLCVSYNLQK